MKGKIKEALTEVAIFRHISEYDIYRFYIGKDFKINKAINSPIPGRNDKTPSFVVSNKDGNYYHFDYGDSSFRGGAIDFVKQMTGLYNYDAVLRRIDKDFGLGLTKGEVKDYKSLISTYQKPDIENTKTYSLIQCKVRKIFFTDELHWWKSFHISEKILREENVYPLTEVWLNKERVPIHSGEMVFGYLYENRWKVYRPFAKMKKNKWLTNVPNDLMDGIKDIRKCDKILITKAKKDKMVIKQIFPCVCSVQGENIAAINQENLSYLRENSNMIYINFDSDAPGKKASWSYTNEFGFKHINVPDQYLEEDIKDFADFARRYGLPALENYFKQKELI